MGMAEYHSYKLDKSNLKAGPVSCSMLKDFAINPYSWLKQPLREPSAAMQTGTLLDAALTEPERLDDIVAVNPYDSFRTKEAREWRDTALAEGKVICGEDEVEHAHTCAQAVREHPVAAKILEGAEFQTAAVAEVGGIPVKALVDILPARGTEWEETLVDYKTTSLGLHDEGIRTAMSRFRYHWQAAFYRTVFNKASEDRHIEQFTFIFQDPKTTEVRVVTLADDAMALGTRCVGEAMKEFVKCAHQGIKSRYLNRADTLDVMPWCAMNEEDTLLANE